MTRVVFHGRRGKMRATSANTPVWAGLAAASLQRKPTTFAPSSELNRPHWLNYLFNYIPRPLFRLQVGFADVFAYDPDREQLNSTKKIHWNDGGSPAWHGSSSEKTDQHGPKSNDQRKGRNCQAKKCD